jgi:hypothetical protein
MVGTLRFAHPTNVAVFDTVIASEAKQSIAPPAEEWIASTFAR